MKFPRPGTLSMTSRKKVRAWVYRKSGSNDYHLAVDWPWWNAEQDNRDFEPMQIELSEAKPLQKKVRRN